MTDKKSESVIEQSTLLQVLEFVEKRIEARYKALLATQNKKPERSYTSEKIDEIAKDLGKLQSEMNTIINNRENAHFKSGYADLHSILKTIRPLLAKHNLALTQQVETDEDGRVFLTTSALHGSGQWIKSVQLVNPNNTQYQEMGKALSYAKRYGVMSLFGATSANDADDDDGAANSLAIEDESVMGKKIKTYAPNPLERGYKTIGKADIALLQTKLKPWPELAKKMLEFYNIDSLAYVPEDDFAECIKRVDRWINTRLGKTEPIGD